MKVFILFLITIILFSISSYGQMKYWEDLSCSQKSEVLANCNSVSIKRFYEGKFIPTDDDKTRKLLDELVSSNDSILPLSFYLFNKICVKSDGALAEMIGKYCAEFLVKSSKYLLTYFSKERKLKVNKPIWKEYARSIGCELYFKIDGTSVLKYSYERFKEILVSASKGNPENEETFKVFWQLVDETIKNMD
jgi:hypothetical protein